MRIVAAALEALVKEPQFIDISADPRVALFRLVSAIWNSVDVNRPAERRVGLLPAEHDLGQISAMPRQAFLAGFLG